MCVHSLQPQEAVKKAVDAASDKASDAADSAKFTLNKDLPISKGTIDAPDTILNQALQEAAKNLPPPPSKLLGHGRSPSSCCVTITTKNSTKQGSAAHPVNNI